MQITIAGYDTLDQHGGLFTSFLRARRDHFIGLKGWQLPEVDGMEFDQYDTPFARYIFVHQGDRLRAGIRVIPTTAQCMHYSYMIRDAQLGLLPGMPTDLLDAPAPVDPRIWEATRGYVCNGISGKDRRSASTMLAAGLKMGAAVLGIESYIAIVETRSRRLMRITGMETDAIGRVFPTTESEAVSIRFRVTDMRARA